MRKLSVILLICILAALSTTAQPSVLWDTDVPISSKGNSLLSDGDYFLVSAYDFDISVSLGYSIKLNKLNLAGDVVWDYALTDSTSVSFPVDYYALNLYQSDSGGYELIVASDYYPGPNTTPFIGQRIHLSENGKFLGRDVIQNMFLSSADHHFWKQHDGSYFVYGNDTGNHYVCTVSPGFEYESSFVSYESAGVDGVVCSSGDGHFYIGSRRDMDTSMLPKWYIQKLDSDLNLVYECDGGFNDPLTSTVKDMVGDKEGNLYALIFELKYIGEDTAFISLVKINAVGEIEWERPLSIYGLSWPHRVFISDNGEPITLYQGDKQLDEWAEVLVTKWSADGEPIFTTELIQAHKGYIGPAFSNGYSLLSGPLGEIYVFLNDNALETVEMYRLGLNGEVEYKYNAYAVSGIVTAALRKTDDLALAVLDKDGVEQVSRLVYQYDTASARPFDLIWPNPAKDYITIDLLGLKINELTITLYNMQGQAVFEKAVLPFYNQFKLPSLATGMYLYNITDNKGEQLQSGKLLIKQ